MEAKGSSQRNTMQSGVWEEDIKSGTKIPVSIPTGHPSLHPALTHTWCRKAVAKGQAWGTIQS